jgi:dihydrofolate reductase
VSGNIAEQVSMLKAKDGEDILVAGSSMLVHALMEHALVDE